MITSLQKYPKLLTPQDLMYWLKVLKNLQKIGAYRTLQFQVKAKILSAIFDRQIGHSEHAREHDLHTAVVKNNFF